MIYSTVKTKEKATELVTARALELGLMSYRNDDYRYRRGEHFETITVEAGSGQVQAVNFCNLNRNISVTCAWDDAEGDDDAFVCDVVMTH